MSATRTLRSDYWVEKRLGKWKEGGKSKGAVFLEGRCRIFVSNIWPGPGKGKQNGEKWIVFKRYIEEIWTRLSEDKRRGKEKDN